MTDTNTPTPRTDAVIRSLSVSGTRHTNVAAFEVLCYELERELAAATARAEKAEAGMKEQCDTCELKCVFDANERYADVQKARAEKAEAALSVKSLRCERLEKTQAICHCGDPLINHGVWGGHSPVEMMQECPFAQDLDKATARIAELEAALNQIANYDTGPLGRTDADAQRWRGMARAALARIAQEADTYVDEDGDTVCIDTRTVIPARQSAKEVAK